ncbi:MAG: DUF4160 domain-containing protein [Planctomycetota bacterium]|nr:DUF4160 domain-containing protein [Planctomycetota bacterium]
MPCISRFYGIAIYMYFSDHAPPHFHAIYGEYDAEIEISSGRVIDGWLPKRVLRLVRPWARVHQDELERNWSNARQERKLSQIEPYEPGR